MPGPGAPGRIALRVARGVTSRELRTTRDLVVALPPSYATGARSYPVLYMQDGQNLFDPATSHAGDWGLPATLEALADRGVEAIAVGIPNAGRRRSYEYSPFRDTIHGGGGGGDRYLAFLVQTVKPLVDRSFRTLPERAHTVIAGSSLGGLISLYALWRHAEVFGAAGVLSPALWFADRAMLRYAERTAPRLPGRIYLDVGTAEGEEAVADARALREILTRPGFARCSQLSWVEDEGAGHDEAAWGVRFREAMPFLLGGSE
jgi:predicted alpha/beta superfamily hydrolase